MIVCFLTHRNFATTQLQPLNDVLQRVKGTVCPDGHGRIVISSEKIMIPVSVRHVPSILAEVED